MKYTHLCMVSDQPLPNILPTLVNGMQAEKVYLLTTVQQKKKGNADAQKKVLENNKVDVTIVDISDPYDLEKFQGELEQLLERKPENETWLLNATGGTKPMSIAAFESCFSCDVPVFYWQFDKPIWLTKNKLETEKSTLPFDCQYFLMAHNVSVNNLDKNKIAGKRIELAKKWARLSHEGYQTLRKINRHAASARNNSLQCDLGDDINNQQLNAVIDEMEQANIAKYDNGKIIFESEDSRFFANGGWLEELLFAELQNLQQDYSKITEVARNVEIEINKGASRKPVKNELDVIAIINGQLWVFECKTKSLAQGQDNTKENEAQQMVYKLAGSMKRMGGLRTQGGVISYNHLSGYDKSRAELFDISVIDGQKLTNLRSELVQILCLNKS